MNRSDLDWGMQTRLIHTGQYDDSTAITPPIYQTSTYRMPTPEAGAELADAIEPTHYYTRLGSPNAHQVETALADLEGGESALAVGSGMAAITTAILSNVRQADHII